MTEKELMSIKRDLQARARRMGLGKARTGAYVFGTLRRIAKDKRLMRNPKSKCDEIYDDNWDDKEVMLVFEKTLKPVCIGQKVKDFRGDYSVVTGGRAPHKPSSEGRVWVREGTSEREYYPSVFGLKWIPSVNVFPIDKVTGKSRLKMNPICPTPAEYKRLISENPRSAQRDVWFLSTKAEVKKLIERKLRKGFKVQSVDEVNNGMYRVVVVKPRPNERIVWGESMEDYARRAFPKIMQNPSENTLFMSLTDRGGKKKTWHIGESAVGGIIAAKVSQNGTAVAIRNATYHGNETISVRLFRWPLDKFSMLVYLNELTTSYYADKIMDWVKGAAKG